MNLDPTQLELLLSQRSDGPLSADERGAIEQTLRNDPRLRDVAGRYDRLADLLRRLASENVTADPRLHRRIVEALREDVEFRVSQSIDGDLSDEERTLLANQTASDPSLARFESQLTQTAGLLARYAEAPIPVDSTALQTRIITTVHRESLRAAASGGRSRLRRWTAFGAPLAAAAAIALAIMYNSRTATITPGPTPPSPPQPTVLVKWQTPARTSGAISIRFDTESTPESFRDSAQGQAYGIVTGRSAPRPTPRATARGSLALMY